MMDENIYDNPRQFIPERFHEKFFNTGARRSALTEYDPESKVFGFGRR